MQSYTSVHVRRCNRFSCSCTRGDFDNQQKQLLVIVQATAAAALLLSYFVDMALGTTACLDVCLVANCCNFF